MKSDDTGGNVFWYGIEGSRRVILRKVASETYQALKDAQFNIYASANSTTPVTDKDGNTLENLKSGAGGAFYIGELNYGTYYAKETAAPSGYTKPSDGYYFIITVNEEGVGYLNTDNTWSNEVQARQP